MASGNIPKNPEKSKYGCQVNFDALAVTAFSLVTCIAVMSFCVRRRRSTRDKSPVSVLYYLAKTSYHPDHCKFAMTLIEKEKYDVNFYDPEEKLSLFLCACLSGNPQLVRFMIEQGANVKSVSHFGDSALYLAVFGYIYLNSKLSNLKTLNILLSAGCNINHQNGGGFTVLHLASSKGKLDLIRYLILQGADPSIRNSKGQLPVDVALAAGQEDVADFFMKRRGRRNWNGSVYF